jgi:hypothetical protein
MSLNSALIFLILVLTVYGPFSKTLSFIAGIPNYASTIRDILLISMGFYGFVHANPVRSPRLLWGVLILFISLFIYMGIAATEDQYLPGLLYARGYILPVFFMMAMAGAFASISPTEANNVLRITMWLNAFTVIGAIVLYFVMMTDKHLAIMLISGTADRGDMLASAWYISGGTWMRMGLPATSPNSLGLFLSLNLVLIAVLLGKSKPILKGGLPTISALTLLAILLTFSRSSLLLFIVGLITLWALNQVNFPRKLMWWTTTIGLIVMISGVIIATAVNPDIGENVMRWVDLNLSGEDPSMQGHISTFKDAWDQLGKYYLHGFPKGTVGPLAEYFTLKINHVENSILGLLYDMGFFLGTFFLIGWGILLLHFYKARTQIAMFLGFFVCTQFLPYFFGADSLITFGYFFALTGLVDKAQQ